MTITTSSFRQVWEGMSLPPNPEATTIRPVSGTNAYLAKNYDGSMGLFLRDVTDTLPKRTYKHLEITIHNKKQVPLPGRPPLILRNVLFLNADHEIKTPALSLILEGLHDQEPSGQFTAADMIAVLDEVEELLRRPKALPTKEEVAGAWGELYVLRLFLQNIKNPDLQRKVLFGWEGETREKLDFRFLYAMQAIEVKTTMSSERIHHLHGIEQVTIPSGFDHGALASLCVETDQGYTCEHLLTSIESVAVGTREQKDKFVELLAKRTLIRGIACQDNRFSFDLIRDGLRFFDFSQVPSPGDVDGVTPIEWLSDLSVSSSLTSAEKDELMFRVIHPRQA
ncbi:PD-(D/E)XK motif protein [Candidatus Poseidoniales archaeon]|nr:PD-(D/E)XK motif protein [Candidatus Poseidoniales archaeon]